MKIKGLVKVVAAVVLVFTFAMVNGQSVNEAGAKMNDGIENYKAKNYQGAVEAFSSCITMCDAIGAEGAELKGKAQKQLVNSFYKDALAKAKKKDYVGSIAGLEKMEKLAKEIGDSKNANRAHKVKANIYVSEALTYYKAENFDKAIATADKSLAINPKYYKAFYAKGLSYKGKGDLTQMKTNMDKALELGATNTKAAKTLAKIRSIVAKAYVAEGGKMIQAGKFADAKVNLDTSLEYNQKSKDTYYYLAVANNGLKSWDAAIDAANKSIALEKGNQSKIHFEIGKAFEGKGDTGSACAAYGKVTSGPNVEAAKYQMETVLKCK